MNTDSQDNKIRSRFFGPQNAQFDTSPLPMRTNECDDSHENSANGSPTTNDHHHHTQKNTGIRIIDHIFKATE